MFNHHFSHFLPHPSPRFFQDGDRVYVIASSLPEVVVAIKRAQPSRFGGWLEIGDAASGGFKQKQVGGLMGFGWRKWWFFIGIFKVIFEKWWFLWDIQSDFWKMVIFMGYSKWFLKNGDFYGIFKVIFEKWWFLWDIQSDFWKCVIFMGYSMWFLKNGDFMELRKKQGGWRDLAKQNCELKGFHRWWFHRISRGEMMMLWDWRGFNGLVQPK